MIDDNQLNEIEERAKNALLPDWRVPEPNKAEHGRRRILSIEAVWTGDDMYAQVTPFTMGDVSTAEFVAHAREDVPALVAEVRRLRAAIIKHRSQKADDRCIEDDDELYAALGDGITCDRRVGNKEAMLHNCARFIEQRCKGGGWPSYAELEEALQKIALWIDDWEGEAVVCTAREVLEHAQNLIKKLNISGVR